MKQIQYSGHGVPHEVVCCVDVPEPDSPRAHEVQVRVAAFPINPADLLTLSGLYARPATPSAMLGTEAIGYVSAIGAAVENVKVGDRVIFLCTDNWTELKVVPKTQVMKLPPAGDLSQLAMLKVNPATAYLMLTSFTSLSEGAWVIQSAANSGVGRNVSLIARMHGHKTINVVRRTEAVDSIASLGGGVTLVDGPELSKRVREAIGTASVRLALDAVGGAITTRLADTLDPTGTLVVYGGMDGRACEVRPDQLVFRDIRIRGFWLTRTIAAMPYEELEQLYGKLAQYVAAGDLYTPIEARYPVTAIKDAVQHASRSARAGKILVEVSTS